MAIKDDVLAVLPQDESHAINTRELFTLMKGIEELEDVSNALGVLFRSNKICRKKDTNTLTNGFVYWIGKPESQNNAVDPGKEKSESKDIDWCGLLNDADKILSSAKLDDSQPVPLQNQSALHIQIGGDHYKKLGAYQPWEVLHKWLTPEELKGFAKGTVIAYLAREAQKGGHQDIEKAAHSLEIYLELVKQK